MAFPEIAYPEPGWLSRFTGRVEQLRILERILEGTRRGVSLPVVQVTGPLGAGKSWFLQHIRHIWRDRVDVPVLLLRLKNPAMADWYKAINAIVTRLLTRWKMNLRLSEFVLGRIAHLRGESIDRFDYYEAALRYIPYLDTPRGEQNLRRVLVEHSTDSLRKLWGPQWGKRFLSMSPQELSWYLPEVLGMDIDQALRTLRFRAFLLLVDDADKIPELYHSFLRMKRHTSLTLFVFSVEKPMPTDGFKLETIPIDPLPLLEQRAYLYYLGVDNRSKQKKIAKSFGTTSIGFPIGVIEHKQLMKRNEPLRHLLNALLVCRRPSLEVLQDVVADAGALAAFFAEPALVDILEQPDRLPWRFMLHPVARRWALGVVGKPTPPKEPAGDTLNRIVLFANKDFEEGMPILYWYVREALSRGEIGDAVDALMGADEIAENFGKDEFPIYHRFLLLDVFAPRFSRRELLRYARQRLEWRGGDDIADILCAARCLSRAGRDRLALWTARWLLPKIAERVMSSRGKSGVYMLLRAEANRIIGLSLARLGDHAEANATFSKAHEAAISAQSASRAIGNEAAIEQIEIMRSMCEAKLCEGNVQEAWEAMKSAANLAFSMLGGMRYRTRPMLFIAGEILRTIHQKRLWLNDKELVIGWVEKFVSLCRDRARDDHDYSERAAMIECLVCGASILLELQRLERALEWLDECEVLLPVLGERLLWRADHWRKLSVEVKLLKAELFGAQGRAEDAKRLATDALSSIERWGFDQRKDTLPLAVKARVIGGVSRSRLGELDDAVVWLVAGTSLAEKALADDLPQEVKLEFYALCGDAYHELARIAFHKKELARAARYAQQGIEHKTRITHSAEGADVYLDIADLYVLLLQSLPQEDEENITKAVEHAIPVIFTACTTHGGDRKRCRSLAEGIFRLALDAAETLKPQSGKRMRVLALSLYPMLADENLRRRAKSLCETISDEDIPPELAGRFKHVRELIMQSGEEEP